MFAVPLRLSLWLGPFLALTVIGQTINAQETGPEAERLNWVPVAELTPEQQAEIPNACCGAYVAPPIPQVSETNEGASQIDADRIKGNFNTGYVAEGNVSITDGLQHIQSQRIATDEMEQTADIQGPITIDEASALFHGERTTLNRETGAAVIRDGEFVLYESRIRGSAGLIERDENDVMRLKDGQFTQCEPGNESWIIKGSEIEIDPNTQKGSIHDMRLEVGGVPVFYLPYWTFPAGGNRQSGLLFPTLSTKEFALPYYFNLAPNYDLTLTPRYILERGSLLELEARHLNRSFDTVLSTSFLPNGKDDISDNERNAIDALGLIGADLTLAEQQAMAFDGEDRWLLGLQQNGGGLSEGPRQAVDLFGGAIPRWSSRIDYTKVSDYAYFSHVNTTNLDINRQSHLRQQGDLGYQFDHWKLNLHAEAYQPIVLNGREPYRQLPKLEFDGIYEWSDGSWQLAFDNEITQFAHREDTRITGQRARADYTLNWDKQWLWGFLKPGVALKSVSYKLDNDNLAVGADHQPGVTIPQATLDGGLYFEREGSWIGSSYLQTFEPRMFYFYSDFEDQTAISNLNFDSADLTFSYSQLFRDTRFAGGDRIEDADQFSLGLTTRFLSNSGQERLRLSLGQIFYNEDRRVNLSANTALQTKSEIAGQIAAQLTDSLQLTGDGLFDPSCHQWNQRGLNLRYYDEQQRIVNVGYRYQRNQRIGSSDPCDPIPTPQNNRDLNQAELSFVLPIAGNWSIIGHTFHDFTADEALDSVIGLEYTDCCYRVRVVGRRWFDNELIKLVNDQVLEHERGIFIEFQLRGLGSVFDTINGILGESIVNYDRREETIR